jgi:hypothetical protein
MEQILKDIQAVAVKLNLNALKTFAYEQGYKNQVDKFRAEIEADIKAQAFPRTPEGEQAMASYIRAKYFGGKVIGAKTSTKNALDGLFAE